MNRETKDKLWWWVLGMADLLLSSKNDKFDYDEDLARCNDEVQRLNPMIYGAGLEQE